MCWDIVAHKPTRVGGAGGCGCRHGETRRTQAGLAPCVRDYLYPCASPLQGTSTEGNVASRASQPDRWLFLRPRVSSSARHESPQRDRARRMFHAESDTIAVKRNLQFKHSSTLVQPPRFHASQVDMRTTATRAAGLVVSRLMPPNTSTASTDADMHAVDAVLVVLLDSSYKRVKGRGRTEEERTSMRSHRPHDSSQPVLVLLDSHYYTGVARGRGADPARLRSGRGSTAEHRDGQRLHAHATFKVN